MKRKGSTSVKLLLAAIFITCVVFPLIQMFLNIDKEGFLSIVNNERFGTVVGNSLKVALVSTVISVALALALSFSITRSRIRGKGIFRTILTLPMLIPSISHGMGLIILFGANGILTKQLNLPFHIYGFGGIVIGSVMYSFPAAFLMLTDVLNYEDRSPYEAAEVLGVSKWRQFLDISLPYLSRPLISVVFSVFTLVITDYGVPLMIGGNYTTLPVMMYQEIVGLLDFGKGSVIGSMLLVPAVVAFVIDLLKKDTGRTSFVTKRLRPRKNGLRDGLCYTLCSIAGIVVIIPIFTFVLLTFVKRYPLDMSLSFDHVFKTFNMKGSTYLINSLIVSVAVALVGTAVAYLTAYCTARMNGPMSRFLHLISITTMAIPGLVLGLSFVLFFKGSWLYGTLAILVLANTVHFFASPYLMIYNSFNIINKNLEDVGATMNISRPRILLDVLIPQTKDTLVEMLAYFFVNSMMTISAVSFLANVSTKQLSLMITQFEANRLMECSAFVSLMILGVNLVVKGLAHILKKQLRKKKAVNLQNLEVENNETVQVGI
ncbi:MAG: ABC transporter permease subunit [Oscillospiraceae bacterium]|nr:ABC transporter permease subunit [Oscillospiraceae bacterium]